MSKLDDAMQRAMTSVPDCVAAGFVDLSSGMVLSVKTVDSHPTEVFDFLAAASEDEGISAFKTHHHFAFFHGLHHVRRNPPFRAPKRLTQGSPSTVLSALRPYLGRDPNTI